MVLTLSSQVRVYLARAAVDLRKAFDGLCSIVRYQFHRDPFTGDVFVFFNRLRDRVKLLVWDGNGFWLLYKRLERGTFDAWRPSGDGAHVEIERTQLMMLLDGVDVRNAKYRNHFSRTVRITRGSERSDQGGESRAT